MRHLVYCIAFACPRTGCVSIHRRARPRGAVPRRVDVSRPQKLLAHSSLVSQRLGFEARSCYCVSFRRSARPCAAMRAHAPEFVSMRRRARPCASIRVHAVQCAPMRLLVGPLASDDDTCTHKAVSNTDQKISGYLPKTQELKLYITECHHQILD